jgi:hypothetical protein
MTAYTVTWHQQALDELTEVWTAAGQRQVVTDSVHRIDRVLRVDPGTCEVRTVIAVRCLRQ